MQKLKREIKFIIMEGIWINKYLNSQGLSHAFDLLEDTCTLPFSGGKAKLFTLGLPGEIYHI